MKPVGGRGNPEGDAEAPAPAPEAPPAPALEEPVSAVPRRQLRWWLLLLGAVAAMGGAGYLVAALVFFPAPLLPNERQVPRILDRTEVAAARDLARADLATQVAAREPHPSAAAGIVIWQDPPPGVAVPKGFRVALTLSSGPPRVAVPDVRGYDVEMAQRLLAALGLRADTVDTTLVAQPGGRVASVEPAQGDSVLLGSRVILHLVK